MSTSSIYDSQPCRGTNRFCTNQSASSPIITIVNSYWVNAYQDRSHITAAFYREELCNGGPRAMTFVETLQSLFGIDIEKKKVDSWSENLESIVDESIRPDHKHYLDARTLIVQYKQTKQIEFLLRLYTLETDFYKVLTRDKEKTKSLFTPIKYYLPTISSRAFKGHCYRGLTMGEQDFGPYQWVLKNNKECHLGTNTFWSTSIDQHVATFFSGEDQQLEEGQLRVIMKFHFTYPCSTAIALFRQPCLSHFQDEEEVLILPGTVFQVTNIEKVNDAPMYEISLEHLDTREELNELRDLVMQNRIDDHMFNLLDT